MEKATRALTPTEEGSHTPCASTALDLALRLLDLALRLQP